MIINKKVENYYYERKKNSNKLFKGLSEKKVSIHSIINHNTNSKIDRDMMARQNDIVLMKMVRKRESLKEYFKLFNFDNKHCRRYFNFKKWGKKMGNDLYEDVQYFRIKRTFLPFEAYSKKIL